MNLELRQIVLNLVNDIDYDIYKDLDPVLSEDPEYAEERLSGLVSYLEAALAAMGYSKTTKE